MRWISMALTELFLIAAAGGATLGALLGAQFGSVRTKRPRRPPRRSWVPWWAVRSAAHHG